MHLLPGVLVVVLSFHAGGFFPNATAITTVAVGAVLVARLLFARRAIAGLSVEALLPIVLLAALSGWIFLSSGWSDAPIRALVEFHRALLYLLVLLLFASLSRTENGARWLVRGLVAGIVVVCACALITRTLPGLWPTEPTIANDRLSYPLTYWNALGLLGTIGIILAFGLTSDLRESVLSRVVAAGALPVLAATVVFTFSRASLALALVGLVAVFALVRTWGAVSGVLVLPFVAMAAAAALGADQLASERPTSAMAVAQGREVIAVTLLAAATALLARWTLVRLDRRALQRGTGAAWPLPRSAVAATAGLVATVIVVGLAAGGADALGRQYDRFVEGDRVEEAQDRRERLFNPGNNGRVSQWRVASDAFDSDRLIGTGAGTYSLIWARDRPSEFRVEDAHSLYLETLAELGVVGGVLIAALILTLVAALVRRMDGPDHAIWATLLIGVLVWAIHAGVDWDWEMPALTLWVFAAGGLAVARRPGDGLRWGTGVPVRIALAGAVVLLLVTPARLTYAEHAARDGRAAFTQKDCDTAIERSQTAIDRLDLAPEPHEIIGYCLIGLGRPERAIASMQAAIGRDPQNWRPRYGLSLALAVAGRDPRPAIREARKRNPLEGLLIETSESLHATSDPRSWRKRALAAKLPPD